MSLKACEDCVHRICEDLSTDMPGEASFSKYDHKSWQILIHMEKTPTLIRQVDTAYLEKLLKVSGIIVSVSRTFPKATMVRCKCTHCG